MPMLFSQKNNVYINTKVIITYSVIVFLHAVLILFSYNYYKNSADYNIYSKMMGYWKRINPTQEETKKSTTWSSVGVYDKNSIVSYKGKYYIAIEDKNAGEPNDVIGNILYVRSNI